MTAGSPFGLGFGFAPIPMPGPVDSDPGPMQLDDEQKRNIVARLLGAQMFHPGSGPAVMGASEDQGQDQGPGQAGGPGASAQAPQGPALDSPLASVLGSMPSMSAGQMPPPQMPAPPQGGPQAAPQDVPQQGAPTPPPGIPSMIGAAFPQMSVLGGPQATGAIPQAGPRAAPQAPAPASSEDDEAAPQAAQGAPAARAVPMPPVRPSELSSLADAAQLPANSFDPLTGQPVSGAPRPLRGDFDPLTGQPVSGSPQPRASRADSGGAPVGQGPEPAVGSPEWAKEHPGLAAWRSIGESGLGDQLLAFGAGMLQGHGFADGAGKGFQNMLAVRQSGAAGDMQRLEYALKLQKAQQEQNTLTSNASFAKSIFAKNGQEISDQQALAFGGNSTIMNDLLKGILPPTEQYTQFEDKDGNRWSRNQRTGQETIALKKEEDKTQTPLMTPEDRAAAGIRPGDTRPAWIDPNKKVTFDNEGETAAIKEYQRARREDGYTGTLLQWKQDEAQAGRNQTTINMPPQELARDKKIGDAIGTDLSDYIAAARPAREKIAALNVLADAWKAGGDKITTGPMAERVLGLKQFARGSLGLNIGDDVSPSELIAKIGTQLATADAKSLTSRPTQFDFATYLRNNPGLNLTPEGNAALIDIKRQQAQHELDLAALARRKENWDNWDDVVADYDRKHPIISPLTGKPLGAASVDFPGAPGGGQSGVQGSGQQPPPAAASRATLEAEARRRGLIR